MKVKIELEVREAESLHRLIGATMTEDIYDICKREKLGGYEVVEELNLSVDKLYSELGAILKFKDTMMGGL